MNVINIVKAKKISQGEEGKLKFREKLATVITGATGTFHFQMMQMFLLFFYTDVMKISASYVAGLFLVVRIFDAIIAPVFGIVVDKVTTPWGKYKPWFAILGIPIAIFGWLTFTNFNLGSTGNLIYATITYIIYSIFGTIITVPGQAITAAVTKRIDERISMGQIGFLSIIIAAMIVSIGGQPLSKSLGFSKLMAIAAIVCILISIFQMITIKEKYIEVKKEDVKQPSFKEMVVAVFTNKTAVIVYITTLSMNLASGIRSAIMIYFFKYVFHNEGLMVVMGLVSVFPMILGVAFSGVITKRIGIKNSIIISIIVQIITGAAIILVPVSQTGVIIYIVLSVVSSIFAGISNPVMGTLLPAAMDYTEWKSGINVNAFMASLNGFVQTFATAISGAMAAGALSLIGYVPNAEQSSTAIFGLKILISIIPAAISVFQICIWWFDLTEEKQNQINKELAERRAATNNE